MPMKDDELLARADAFARQSRSFPQVQLVADLAAALRAALAVRPQPLFEGRANELRYTGGVPWSPFDINQRVVVYPVSAGPATPIEELDLEALAAPIVEFIKNPDPGKYREAGSATPTGDDDE